MLYTTIPLRSLNHFSWKFCARPSQLSLSLLKSLPNCPSRHALTTTLYFYCTLLYWTVAPVLHPCRARHGSSCPHYLLHVRFFISIIRLRTRLRYLWLFHSNLNLHHFKTFPNCLFPNHKYVITFFFMQNISVLILSLFIYQTFYRTLNFVTLVLSHARLSQLPQTCLYKSFFSPVLIVTNHSYGPALTLSLTYHRAPAHHPFFSALAFQTYSSCFYLYPSSWTILNIALNYRLKHLHFHHFSITSILFVVHPHICKFSNDNF